MLKYACVLLVGTVPLLGLTGLSFVEALRASGTPAKSSTRAGEKYEKLAEAAIETLKVDEEPVRSLAAVSLVADSPGESDLKTNGSPRVKQVADRWKLYVQLRGWVDGYVRASQACSEASKDLPDDLKRARGKLQKLGEEIGEQKKRSAHVEKLSRLVSAQIAELDAAIERKQKDDAIRKRLNSAELALSRGNLDERGLDQKVFMVLDEDLPADLADPTLKEQVEDLRQRADYQKECIRNRTMLAELNEALERHSAPKDPIAPDFERRLAKVKTFLEKPPVGNATEQALRMELTEACQKVEAMLAEVRVELADDFVELLQAVEKVLGKKGIDEKEMQRHQKRVEEWLKDKIPRQLIQDVLLGGNIQEALTQSGDRYFGIFEEIGQQQRQLRYWPDQVTRDNPLKKRGVSPPTPIDIGNLIDPPHTPKYRQLADEYNDIRDKLFSRERASSLEDWRRFIDACKRLEKELKSYRDITPPGTPQRKACEQWSFEKSIEPAQDVIDHWEEFSGVRLRHSG